MFEFDDSSEVIIFSDEPQWCMEQKLFDFLKEELKKNEFACWSIFIN